ncbi:hypothetical protein QR685DRAFT_535624 [Neurospora intermedia]|uniref:Uncharacterized protein n=1 Tax=Neurospora intermedia TaxID=5142 RepID=A0ABR3D1S8_NEUIN
MTAIIHVFVGFCLLGRELEHVAAAVAVQSNAWGNYGETSMADPFNDKDKRFTIGNCSGEFTHRTPLFTDVYFGPNVRLSEVFRIGPIS